ncbi:hypothetical protein PHK61_11730 [Actinomycetospora lutea]|uniref:hypothetical protein n=1 Tax=Actinomycetospora lutea TaxID=663604 RepID=UPI0023654B45|nr:hypothetical protein [Actinomycetospora lutea]MDD7939085.1 hypothetical protein [Actinomycetospora lutea]
MSPATAVLREGVASGEETTGVEVRGDLDRGWWAAFETPTPGGPVDGPAVLTEHTGTRLRIEARPATTPRELDRALADVRPVLGRSVQHVVLDVHRLGDGDPVLARALERLRTRLLVHGVSVEVVGVPPSLRARWGDGRPVRYHLEEDPS